MAETTGSSDDAISEMESSIKKKADFSWKHSVTKQIWFIKRLMSVLFSSFSLIRDKKFNLCRPLSGQLLIWVIMSITMIYNNSSVIYSDLIMVSLFTVSKGSWKYILVVFYQI